MSHLKERWKDLFSRKQREAELQDELQFHVAMQEQDNIRAGMNPEEAHRSAILKLGGFEQTKERTREQRFGFWLETLLKDIAYGFRMLRKTPALTFVCLIMLTLAIGACTAIFSILHGIVLRPLPFPEPDRIVEVVETNLSRDISRSKVNARNLNDWRTRSGGFDAMAAYFTMGRTLSDNNMDSEVILATQVSADYFYVFQTAPVLGRTFTEDETKRTQYDNTVGLMSPDPLVILSYRLWMRRFGTDPDIVGKSVVIDRREWRVIGVMPRHFAMPDQHTDVWIPWGLRNDSSRDQRFAGGIARLSPGVSISQAEQRLNRIAVELAREFPESSKGWNIQLNSLQETLTQDVRQILWFLFTAVGLLLLIASVNIAIVQLGLASTRIQESSVRMALGASRTRLVRQFLIESFILAFFAGVLGLLLAYFAITTLQHLQPNLPRVSEITLDRTVLLISVAISILAGLLFGLGPAFITTRSSGNIFSGESLRSTSRVSTQRLRNTLVVTEVALAVILLSSSCMLIRSFLKLEEADAGFNPRNVLVLPVFLDSVKYNSGSKSRAYYKELMERLQQLPDVVSAGGATALPASPLGPDFQRPVWEMGRAPQDHNKRHADVRIVTPDYFQALGISIMRGRGFSTQDGPDAPGVLMVNESLAAQIWPGLDPVGKQLVVDYSTSGTYGYQVIGVVRDTLFRGPRSTPRPELYFPHDQRPYLVMNIAVRSKGDPKLLIGGVREVLRSIDPQKPAHSIATLEDLVGATVIRDRYAMILASSFAVISLMLASFGIYGVLAFFVRQKRQEIGIRLALGAHPNQIIAWIGRVGAILMFNGLAIGLIAALAFSHLLSGILYRVSSRDLPSMTVTALAITLTALAAVWIPARRGARVEPSITLRYE